LILVCCVGLFCVQVGQPLLPEMLGGFNHPSIAYFNR
jgi:hypothetical protein